MTLSVEDIDSLIYYPHPPAKDQPSLQDTEGMLCGCRTILFHSLSGAQALHLTVEVINESCSSEGKQRRHSTELSSSSCCSGSQSF